jgi:predicted phage terminase large subunit-like protein
LVPIDKLQRFAPDERPRAFDSEVLSLDTAYKDNQLADYSVCTRWGKLGTRIYLLDVWRMKASYHVLKEQVRAMARSVRPERILIEDSASGQPLIQELLHEGLPGVTGRKPEGQKAVRMLRAQILIEAGEVYIPTAAPWLNDYLHELAAFPAGRWDDQVDSTSQALNWFLEERHEPSWIRYAREETERMRREREPQPEVWMRMPPGVGAGYGLSGRHYTPDWTTMLVLVCPEDVAPFVRAGWAVVDT